MILGRPAIRVEVRRQYWSQIRAGEVPGDAGRFAGKNSPFSLSNQGSLTLIATRNFVIP
jgi:hypothetical protein